MRMLAAELAAMAWPEVCSEADICCSSELELGTSPGICDAESKLGPKFPVSGKDFIPRFFDKAWYSASLSAR